jgi:hypothetical protein
MAASDTIGGWKGLGSRRYVDQYGIIDAVRNDDDVDVKLRLKYLSVGQLMLRGGGQGVAFYRPLSDLGDAAALVSHSAGGESTITDLERHNAELCRVVAKHAPYRQFVGTSLVFLLFFSAALTIQLFTGIWLIAPALAWVGIGLSSATVLLSYLATLDWRDWRSRGSR